MQLQSWRKDVLKHRNGLLILLLLDTIQITHAAGNAPAEVIRALVFSLGPRSIVGGRPRELRFLPAL